MATFEVVAMAFAPPEHIYLFARHYLRCGAKKVTVYIDRSTDAPVESFDGMDLVNCDDAFWSRIGPERPFFVEDRQRAIYNFHFKHSTVEWLLRVDIDELIIGCSDLDGWLGQVPSDAIAVQVRTAEAVYGVNDDIHAEYSARSFRIQYGRYAAPIMSRILYGRYAPFFSRGLLGHAIGKQFIRTENKDVILDIHHACLKGKTLSPKIADGFDLSPSIYLAHFDAISFRRWREKFDRRLECNDLLEAGFNVKREKQKAFYKTAREQGLKQTEALFLRFYGLNHFQKMVLKANGKLLAADSLKTEYGDGPDCSD